MPTVFWTGKISPTLKLVVNSSSALALITGNARDTSAMKERLKKGYDGVYSDYVTHYDERGIQHYSRIAKELLNGCAIQGKEVLDVGCGTGISSVLALEQGASKMICGDLSQYMLDQCRVKLTSQGYSTDQVDFRLLDAESLPLDDNSVDAAISSMVLGMVPSQAKAIGEMGRVLRCDGVIALATHGRAHYQEAIEAALTVMTMRYHIGYRFEFWPRREADIQNFLIEAGLSDIRTHSLTWKDSFEDGGEAFDFFASTSSLWWYAKFPSEIRGEEAQKARDYFGRERVTQITSDVIFAYAQKP